MPEPILRLQNVVVRHAEQAVLQVSALDILEGEVLAVIGPNGAGKSTLLLVLSRLLQPERGQLFFRGQPYEEEAELTFRRRIGLVLQEPLLMHQSVYENVAAVLKFRGLPRPEVKRRSEEWLQRLEISQLKHRSASRLSGGEAQRTSLARAFALQPELLMLDEPFSALDSPTRARLLQDLHSLLVQTGVTTIFITHVLDEALLLADRVAVLLGGVLRQVGRPQDVFSAPSDAEVAAFVGVETVISGIVTDSDKGQLKISASELHLEAVGDIPVGRQVLFCLRPEDVTVSRPEVNVQSSARNHVSGCIQRITPSGPLVRLVIDCGLPIIALVTRSSASEMQLAEGQTVTASFKATAVHLIPR